jgi:2-hydroxy-3-keto-5-methylthiopentenyl-1-phosphate phosphatase
VCARHGLEVLTNAVDFESRELLFPHEDRCCACSSCGVCKQAPIKDARYQGRTTVLIGDGASDRKAALLADVVFAKGPLASWCARFGVPCHRFETLADVRRALFG